MVVAKEERRTRRVDKGKSGQAQITAVSGGFGGGILSQIKSKRRLFWGNGATFVTQLTSNNSGAADCRLDGAWGSLPGKISSPHFFVVSPILNPCKKLVALAEKSGRIGLWREFVEVQSEHSTSI